MGSDKEKKTIPGHENIEITEMITYAENKKISADKRR